MSDAVQTTIGQGIVDLGQIDRLMDMGLLVTRSEFIHTAIRTSPEQYRKEVVQAGFNTSFAIATHILNAYGLEDVVA